MRKISKLFLFFFSFFIVHVLFAQQWQYHNPYLWTDVNAVEILGPGIISTGGGWETNDSIQIMFQSSDYGQTWSENTHDGLAPWNKSIAFSDPLNGYGVGYDGRIIKTDDAGLNWGYQVYPVNRDLNKIVFVDGTYYVAGGNKTNDSIQTILKSTDYGNTWNVMYDTLGSWLKSIFFIDTLKGFAVGDNGTILSTTDGGNSWVSVPAPLQRDFNSITFINGDTGFIVGGIPVDTCRRTILRTTDGGANWNVLTDTIGGILNDISFADTLIGYAVGDSATVLMTSDGGQSWPAIIIDTNLAGNETFNAVKFYDKTFGAAAGKAGMLYVYQNRLPEVFTLGMGQIGTTDATLLGGINTHTKNASYSFVYSTGLLFTSPETTPEVNVQNDSLLLISENIQGLTPDTAYYYFLKATTATDTIYGDTLSFFTGVNPSFDFQTHDATGVGSWAAYLNGFINKFPGPVNLFFEYGSSPAFDSLVAAVPASVNDTFPHSLQVFITGLQANKQYFFRLKGVTGSGTYYGYTKMFNSVNLPLANTGNATNVTLTSAQLNGNVNNYGFASAIKFEYGLTAFYGNEANAVPDSVTDTVNVPVSYLLTGLSPGITYHFRVKAITSNGTGYGGDMTFIPGGPSANTFLATFIDAGSVMLKGMVNANNFPTENKFDYGNTSAYGNEVSAIPDSCTGNSAVFISFPLTGLIPDSIYHYRVKATNNYGTTYGNDVIFVTGFPSVYSFAATEVSLNSAKLNGSIDAGGFPTAVKFEYGTTTSYGNEINAIPDSASGNGNIDVYAVPTGLAPNTIYHFRIIGTNNMHVNYGNDMVFFTGYPEIPNFDFEYWDSVHFEKPVNWTTIGYSEKVPSYNGTNAVQMGGNANGASAVFCGTISKGGGGGIPFSARPDSIVCHVKYDVVPGDTAYVSAWFKLNGSMIYQLLVPITGNSGGNFIRLSYPLIFPDSNVPDSLLAGAINTNAFWGPPNPASMLTIDDLSFTGQGSGILIPNADFEDWESIDFELPTSWSSNKEEGGMSDSANFIQKTTDRVSGNYGLRIENNPSISPKPTSLNVGSRYDYDKPAFPINARHETFDFYAKYQPQNGDTLNLRLNLYSNGVLIGGAAVYLDTAVLVYSPFCADIYYLDSFSTPDSAELIICIGVENAHGNSLAWIDYLSFDGFSHIETPVPEITEILRNMLLNIYPNPANDRVNLDYYNPHPGNVIFSVYDIFGKLLYYKTEETNQAGTIKRRIDISSFEPGIYFIRVASGKNISSGKLILLK